MRYSQPSTHQIVHVGSGEHVRPHVGVLVEEGVQQQRGLVGALLLAQRRVQTVEIDLESVRLLHGQRRRVYMSRSECYLDYYFITLWYTSHTTLKCGQWINTRITLRVSETNDSLPVGVGPVGPICQIGEDQQ